MTDKLKQAAAKNCTGVAGPMDYDCDKCKGFLAGASYQDPISRAEERARILGMLRSDEARTFLLMNYGDRNPSRGEWADWLEKTLKAGE